VPGFAPRVLMVKFEGDPLEDVLGPIVEGLQHRSQSANFEIVWRGGSDLVQ